MESADVYISHPQVPQLYLFPRLTVLGQVVLQFPGVLLGSFQVQLILIGFYLQAQLLHRHAVISVGTDRKAVGFPRQGHNDRTAAWWRGALDVRLIIGERMVGSQQNNAAHLSSPFFAGRFRRSGGD